MSYESIIVAIYFTFLFALLYASRNVQRIAEHPKTQAVFEKITYNLRKLPRVDYTEILSDEDEEEEQEEEGLESPMEIDSLMEVDSESEEEGLRKRRDRNPLGRMIEATD